MPIMRKASYKKGGRCHRRQQNTFHVRTPRASKCNSYLVDVTKGGPGDEEDEDIKGLLIEQLLKVTQVHDGVRSQVVIELAD